MSRTRVCSIFNDNFCSFEGIDKLPEWAEDFQSILAYIIFDGQMAKILKDRPCLQSAIYTHDVVLGFFIVMCGLYNCERWRHQFGCKIQRFKFAVGSSQIISILLRVEIDTWCNEEDAKTSKSNFNLNVSLFSLDTRLFPPLKHNLTVNRWAYRFMNHASRVRS